MCNALFSLVIGAGRRLACTPPVLHCPLYPPTVYSYLFSCLFYCTVCDPALRTLFLCIAEMLFNASLDFTLASSFFFSAFRTSQTALLYFVHLNGIVIFIAAALFSCATMHLCLSSIYFTHNWLNSTSSFCFFLEHIYQMACKSWRLEFTA